MTCGVILGGGAGTRMGELVRTVPKMLLPYRGRALIEYPLASFRKAGINDIYVVGGCHSDAVRRYLVGNHISYIEGDPTEHVFYAIWRALCATTRVAHWLVFMDGDTACSEDVIVNDWTSAASGCDGVVIATRFYNHPSQWILATDEAGVVTAVTPGIAQVARVVMILRRSVADAVFSFAGTLNPLDNWRSEGSLLRGFERYFTGWGLLMRIAINLGARLEVRSSPFEMCNVNSAADLE